MIGEDPHKNSIILFMMCQIWNEQKKRLLDSIKITTRSNFHFFLQIIDILASPYVPWT